MIRITTFFLLSLIGINAQEIGRLILKEESIETVISMVEALDQVAIEIPDNLPKLRLDLDIRHPVEKEEALAILTELLRVNGVDLRKTTQGVYTITRSEPLTYNHDTTKSLRDRLGTRHWKDISRLCDSMIGSVIFKDESVFQAFDLIERLTGKTAIRSTLITQAEGISFAVDKVSGFELIELLDSLLTAQSIYMIGGDQDTIIFLQKL